MEPSVPALPEEDAPIAQPVDPAADGSIPIADATPVYRQLVAVTVTEIDEIVRQIIRALESESQMDPESEDDITLGLKMTLEKLQRKIGVSTIKQLNTLESEWRGFEKSELDEDEDDYSVADDWADIETFQYLNPAALMIIRNFIFKKSSDRRSELAELAELA